MNPKEKTIWILTESSVESNWIQETTNLAFPDIEIIFRIFRTEKEFHQVLSTCTELPEVYIAHFSNPMDDSDNRETMSDSEMHYRNVSGVRCVTAMLAKKSNTKCILYHDFMDSYLDTLKKDLDETVICCRSYEMLYQ